MSKQALDILERARASGIACEEDLAILAARPQLREEVLRVLLADPHPQDRGLVLGLLQAQTEEHRSRLTLGDDLIVCAYLLARQRRLEDVMVLWTAKAADFTTFLGLSVVLLVAAGVERTIEFLIQEATRSENQAVELPLEVIDHARDEGRLDNLDSRLEQIRAYCENSLATRPR